MGLDWCVEAKVSGENKARHGAAVRLLNAAQREYTKQLEEWVEAEVAALRSPARWCDTELAERDFVDSKAGRVICRTVEECAEAVRALEVAAAATLGAPVVGVDDIANTWVTENWKSMRRFDTAAEALRDLHGEPVVVRELLPEESCAGLGSVTGIAVGPESFRGKMLRFIGWLPKHLLDEAYTDHTPDQLADYGARLMEIVKRAPEIIRAAGLDPHEEQQNHEVVTLRSAARWCLFWGVRGHGMHAWY